MCMLIRDHSQNFDRHVQTLEQRLSEGVIWNSEYQDIKFALSNIIWKNHELRDLLLNSGDNKPGHSRTQHDDYPGISELYHALPSNVHEVASAQKKYDKCRNKCPKHVQDAADAYFAVWTPINNMMNELKPLIKKGRKPSETPSTSELRTLENTGTCPVCGGNYKLDAHDNMVNHGYKVEHHQFEGGCPGIGYLPWEISKEGAVKYKARLEEALTSINSGIERLLTKPELMIKKGRDLVKIDSTHESYERILNKKIYDARYTAQQFQYDIERYAKAIEAWQPQTLPGIKAGFKR